MSQPWSESHVHAQGSDVRIGQRPRLLHLRGLTSGGPGPPPRQKTPILRSSPGLRADHAANRSEPSNDRHMTFRPGQCAFHRPCSFKSRGGRGTVYAGRLHPCNNALPPGRGDSVRGEPGVRGGMPSGGIQSLDLSNAWDRGADASRLWDTNPRIDRQTSRRGTQPWSVTRPKDVAHGRVTVRSRV